MCCTCFSWSNLAWNVHIIETVCYFAYTVKLLKIQQLQISVNSLKKNVRRRRMRRCCCSLVLEKLMFALPASWLLSTGCKQTNIHNNVITWVKRKVIWVQPGADVCDGQVTAVNLKIVLPQPQACLKWSLWSLQTSFWFVAVFTASRSQRAPCSATNIHYIIWLVREALWTNRIRHVQKPNLNAKKSIKKKPWADPRSHSLNRSAKAKVIHLWDTVV